MTTDTNDDHQPAGFGAMTCSAFTPAKEHYTRENWLAYRVIAQLSESGLDINTSPAVQVWDVVHREIIAWMEEHGIKTGLRPQERDSSPNVPALAQSGGEKSPTKESNS